MAIPTFPTQGSINWYAWAQGVDGAARANAPMANVEGLVVHDGTAGGGTRPTGYFRVRWVGGTTQPTNMVAGDIWEHDAV